LNSLSAFELQQKLKKSFGHFFLLCLIAWMEARSFRIKRAHKETLKNFQVMVGLDFFS